VFLLSDGIDGDAPCVFCGDVGGPLIFEITSSTPEIPFDVLFSL
jgi:hypothetical protein